MLFRDLGQTALETAFKLSKCKWPMTELLLQLGANIDTQNGSLIFHEIRYENVTGVTRLLELGANPLIKDWENV